MPSSHTPPRSASAGSVSHTITGPASASRPSGSERRSDGTHAPTTNASTDSSNSSGSSCPGRTATTTDATTTTSGRRSAPAAATPTRRRRSPGPPPGPSGPWTRVGDHRHDRDDQRQRRDEAADLVLPRVHRHGHARTVPSGRSARHPPTVAPAGPPAGGTWHRSRHAHAHRLRRLPRGAGTPRRHPGALPREHRSRADDLRRAPGDGDLARVRGWRRVCGLNDEAWESFERTSREDGLATAQEASAALIAAGLTADAAAERSRAGANTVTRILETAEDWDADVIATGTRGRGGVKRALLGSTSTALLHRAVRPVLVVPREAAPGDGPAIVAYDGSPAARAAVEVTARGVGDREVLVVNVWDSPDYAVGVMASAGGSVDVAPKPAG